MSVRLQKSMTPLLLQLGQKLRHRGPAGVLFWGTVHNAIHRHLPYEFVVDSLTDLQAGMARSPLPPEFKRIDEVITIYAHSPEALSNLLANQDLVNWDKRTVFKPVPPSCIPVLKEASGRNGVWKYTYNDPHYMVHVAYPWEPVPKFKSEHELRDYHLGSLDPSHADQLAREWGYSEEGPLEYFTSRLQHGISVAAYEALPRTAETYESSSSSGISGEAMKQPVAYAVQSDDMSILHFYVSPQHRQKHLGTLVLSELVRKLHALNIAAFGYVSPENMISQRAFTRCGMKQQPGEWYWLEFIPHGHKSTYI